MPKNGPYTMRLRQGEYFWCSCGKSETAPFCDGSHGGITKRPLAFSIRDHEEVSLCGCGRTKTPPYCDGSHGR